MPERINALPDAALLAELRSCCGSEAWASAFLRRRPFADVDAARAAADAAFDELTEDEWRRALTGAAVRGTGAGDEATCEAARIALRLYEERFGHPFVAVMSTPAADELLMRVRIRLGNEPPVEWRTTCDEQRRLTRLCVQRLFTGWSAA